jgi:hypothetical protein
MSYDYRDPNGDFIMKEGKRYERVRDKHYTIGKIWKKVHDIVGTKPGRWSDNAPNCASEARG